MKTAPERELEIVKFEIFQLESQYRPYKKTAVKAVERRLTDLRVKQKLIMNRIEQERRSKQTQKTKEDPLVVL